MNRRLALAALVAALAGVAAAAETRPRIEELSMEWREGWLWAGYRVAEGLTDETRERLQSGIPIELEHRLEVVSRRAVPLLPARVHARAVVRAEAVYDALTGRYDLVRRTELRRRGESPEREVERQTTDSEVEMREFMTRVPPQPLYQAEQGETTRPLRLHVESELARRFTLLLFPTRLSVTAERPLED